MQPPERPEHDTASHLDGDGHKGVDSTIVTFLVITLGFTLAFVLAALHLGGT